MKKEKSNLEKLWKKNWQLCGRTEEFRELNRQYRNLTGEDIPGMMVPGGETFGGLYEKVMESVAAERNLLGDYYLWEDGKIY